MPPSDTGADRLAPVNASASAPSSHSTSDGNGNTNPSSVRSSSPNPSSGPPSRTYSSTRRRASDLSCTFATLLATPRPYPPNPTNTQNTRTERSTKHAPTGQSERVGLSASHTERRVEDLAAYWRRRRLPAAISVVAVSVGITVLFVLVPSGTGEAKPVAIYGACGLATIAVAYLVIALLQSTPEG